MNYILFDGQERVDLLPLTFTRPISELRVGILTIREKWEKWLSEEISWITEPYLAERYPMTVEADNMVINATVLPNAELINEIKTLNPGERLVVDNVVVGYRVSGDDVHSGNWQGTADKNLEIGLTRIKRPWDIFGANGAQIRADIELMELQRNTRGLGPFVRVIGKDLYLEEGVEMIDTTINTEDGPVYLGKNVKILEGALIKGPFAACEGALVKMGAKMYGDTTIGPYCKVAGEINNSILQGYSNKGHDGFLGNSVVGEWCNLGADTNNSNLKNNYGIVKAWSYADQAAVSTGLQFCGLIMGDHSKTGINTMLNTGTTVGMCANIFGGTFPPKFVPSFTWGGVHGKDVFKLEKAFEVAERMMSRRGVEFTAHDQAVFRHVFDKTAAYRG